MRLSRLSLVLVSMKKNRMLYGASEVFAAATRVVNKFRQVFCSFFNALLYLRTSLLSLLYTLFYSTIIHSRWLRARKYDLPAVISMVESAVAMRAGPSQHDFYPDPQKALGVEPSVYISQYPQLYCGHCKDGFPLFISKPGVLNVQGISCISTIEGILRYHWYAMIHEFGDRLRSQKKKDPNFKRFEVVCVIDLENLAVSNVGTRPMNIIKVQAQVDSLCFPETLHKFIIINAPSAFSLIWNVIKGWIDARTASKVEIYSYRTQWEPRLLQLVESSELPSDYGGSAIPTKTRLEMENKEAGVSRQYARTYNVCKIATTDILDVRHGEEMEIFVMTRSLREGEFSFAFLDDDNKPILDDPPFPVDPVVVKHSGKGVDEEEPTRMNFPFPIKGPSKFQLKITCNTGSWSSESFLVAAKVRNAPQDVSAQCPTEDSSS